MGNLKMFQPPQGIQPAAKRIKNFQEVSAGLPKRVMLEEARRCPQCSNPTCKTACPLGIDIPGFIRLLREGDAAGAFSRIHESNPFPDICGRVCLAPCEKSCILAEDNSPIAIRALERYAADNAQSKFLSNRKSIVEPTGKRVAVVGSGVSGLSAARVLARKNYRVTVFECLSVLGGVLRYGVPEFRLPHKILDRDIIELQSQGVEFKVNTFISRSLSLDDLFSQGFSSVILATGTGGAQLSDLPGVNLARVYYVEEILMNVNLSPERVFRQKLFVKEGKRCVVIGKNYAALDCSRILARLGKDVTMVFDCSDEDLSIYPQDVEQAKEEGVKLNGMTQVSQITSSDGICASGVKCVSLDFADPHSTGKWELSPVPETEVVWEADTVILSQGHRVNTSISRAISGLKSNEDGTIWFAEDKMTSLAGVLVAGDAATGASAIVYAMASGKIIAQVVEQYLTAK